ncbi:hypothetical protein ERJ75_000898800 [Trypanosoma vivax]|nr:hypothetical protein ERJ75_000898800 [Trypanosoma vivax]
MQPAPQRFTRKHRGQGLGVERAESTRVPHGLRQDLIIGTGSSQAHLRKPHNTRKVAGTAADLAGQLEAAAHAIVHHEAKPEVTQKMCLGQVVSNQACDGGASSGAYAAPASIRRPKLTEGRASVHQSPAHRRERTPQTAETARRRDAPQRHNQRNRKAKAQREREAR